MKSRPQKSRDELNRAPQVLGQLLEFPRELSKCTVRADKTADIL